MLYCRLHRARVPSAGSATGRSTGVDREPATNASRQVATGYGPVDERHPIETTAVQVIAHAVDGARREGSGRQDHACMNAGRAPRPETGRRADLQAEKHALAGAATGIWWRGFWGDGPSNQFPCVGPAPASLAQARRQIRRWIPGSPGQSVAARRRFWYTRTSAAVSKTAGDLQWTRHSCDGSQREVAALGCVRPGCRGFPVPSRPRVRRLTPV